jgi:hypothetical protein
MLNFKTKNGKVETCWKREWERVWRKLMYFKMRVTMMSIKLKIATQNKRYVFRFVIILKFFH